MLTHSLSIHLSDPTAQSDFTQQVVNNVTAIEAGHQCYKVADIPDTVEPGANATIQLEYWSSVDNELGGRNQSFYACADVVGPFYRNASSCSYPPPGRSISLFSSTYLKPLY